MEAAAPAPRLKGGRPSKNGQRLRRFVFTVNNYTEHEWNWLTTVFPHRSNGPRWMVIGREVGEEGTPHLQGACVLDKQNAFVTIKMWDGFKRAHIEAMRGSPQDNKTYCCKQDKDAFECGIIPQPGKQKELQEACYAIENGQSLREMAMDNHGIAIVKFHKGLTVYRSLRSAPRDPSLPPDIYWLYGKTGTGKTRSIWEFATAYGGPEFIWFSSGGLQWFDGYDGQPLAVFDDFRPKGVKFDFILRLTDIYPMQVPFKGGFVNWCPRVIFFTTPKCIEDTFEQRNVHRPEDVSQLSRRVTASYHIPDDLESFSELIRDVPGRYLSLNPGS